MPFYLYGSDEKSCHIDHMLLLAPNIQLSASNISLSLGTGSLSPEVLRAGCILFADGIEEAAMQPFLPTSQLVSGQGPTSAKNFFFQPGKKFKVTVFRDRYGVSQGGPGLGVTSYGDRLASGEMVLGDEVWLDSETCNRDPFKRPSQGAKWREEFDKIGRELD